MWGDDVLINLIVSNYYKVYSVSNHHCILNTYNFICQLYISEAEQVKNKINAMCDPRLGLGLKQTV